MPAFDTLSEVIVYARDLERLFWFYTGVFGLSVVEGSPDEGFVRFETGSCNLCLHSGGEDVKPTRKNLVAIEERSIRQPARDLQIPAAC